MKKLIITLLISLLTPAFVVAEETSETEVQEQIIAHVYINRDGVERIAELMNGVGPKIAERIVAYREANGPFESIEQIMEVKGIGPKTLEKNRSLLKI